ncbi:MAG: C25 family cysteine peptidase, partial [Candidatus Electryonea clarkiae]|nr:C25 family cysteine peptidase [Candidatus Electryonea clarkiae]
MKRLICMCIALLMVVFSSFGAARNDALIEKTLPVSVQERTITNNGMNLKLGFNEVIWSTVGSDDDPVELAEVYGGQMLEEEGFPAVPVAGRLFRLPPRSGVIAEIINAEYETFSDIEYAIRTGNDDQYGMTKDRDPVDRWYPENVAVIGEPAIFGDFRVTNLVTYPVQVNTARREVRVYHNLEVEIRFEGIDERNALDRTPTKISEAKLPLYKLFLDWDDSELDEYTLYRGGVMVVMRSSQNLMNIMQPWFEWKLQRGWEIELLTDDDVAWNNNAIRGELQDRYEDAETPFDYVVIIGDDTGPYSVMPGSGNGNYQGDHPYTLLAGNDQLSDVGLGRISIRTDMQLRIYINKVFAYERDPDLDNTDWYLRGMVNNARSYGGNTKRLMLRYIRHAMLDIGYTQVDTTWNRGANGNNYAIDKIEDGVSMYAGRGWANAGLTIPQIMGLENAFMTPVTIDVTCYTGNWSTTDCITEAYIRAGTVNTPTGGISGMGMATGGTNPGFNHVMSAGAAWALLDLRMLTIGDMKLTSTFNGWQNYETGNNTGWRIWAQYFNLMGDPTVWPWTTIPQVITVTAEEEIDLGTNNYEVTAEDEDGNPLIGAWVTFYKVDDDEEIIVRGISDEDGFVSLDVPVRYAGDGMLTVSKQHFAPNQIEVEVVSPNARVGYTEVTIIDDGDNGTDGNDNGIPEAGETVGLQIQAKNYGNAQETNIEFSGSSDEEWIDGVEGSVTIASLNSGQTTTGNGLILVEIAPEAQNEWILHVDIEAETDASTYEDSYPINVAAPQFVVEDITSDDDFEPGETLEITIELMNAGHSNADAATGVLFSNEAFVRVMEDEADYDAMDVEESASGTFEIMLHEETIPGYYAHLLLTLITESGQVDTVGVKLQLGEKSSTDPSGPDEYGYYAFDNTDDGYEDYVPTYDWVEISDEADDPDFEGDELDLSDGAENQDESIVIDLPFTVQYYGEEFDEATVCTNGWIAMGSQGDMFHSRNWTIPAPDGPNYMICAFWDDLRLTGDGNVYTYYDQANGRFIIEWYDVSAAGQNNRFEIIIYSQRIRPTYSGDNDILFQYDDVGPSSNSMAYDVPYWTTGIENGNQDGGLLYYFYNNPAPGAVEDDDFDQGLVILFSTNVALITGTLEGTVTDLATGDPMEDILVYTTDTLYSAVTNEEGYYLFEEQPIGHWELLIEIDCYNPITNEDVEVLEDETTVVDFALRHPEFVLDPVEVEQDLQNVDEINVPVLMINDGNGYLDYQGRIYLQDPRENPNGLWERTRETELDELDELIVPWDFAASWELDTVESRNRGIIYIDRYFYVTGSDNFDPTGPNKIYQYSRHDAELMATYDQPVPEENRSTAGMFGLTWDGEYLYGIDENRMYQMVIDPSEENYQGSIELEDSWDLPM